MTEIGSAGTPNGATTTYRFLRFGVIAAVVMLTVSLYEWVRAPGDCLQTSISAYYYTPVRSIFVGGLIVIGFSLIVVKGARTGEDMCLNLAGMFAPVVALVPTSGAGDCFSMRLSPDPTVIEGGKKVLAPWVHGSIQNNMFALFVAGIFAVILIVVLRWRGQRGIAQTDRTGRLTVSLMVTIALLAVGVALFLTWSAFELQAHSMAAGLMFLFLGVVVFLNAREDRAVGYKRLYNAIWVAMALSLAVGLLLMTIGFRHSILVLEILEILLFTTFWAVETKEEWTEVRV